MGGGGRRGAVRHDGRAGGHDPAGRGSRGTAAAMNVSVVGQGITAVAADAVVVGVHAEDKKLREPAARLNEATGGALAEDRKSTRLNSSHPSISYAVFCLKKKKNTTV